jgi:hypothetical protein
VTGKGPTASEIGRKGGLAGKGASQRRSVEFYRAQGKARAEKRWAKYRAEKKAKEEEKP